MQKAIDDEDDIVFTREMFQKGKRLVDVYPPEFFQGMAELKEKRLRGRPKTPAPKRVKSFKLSPDVIDGVVQSGPGYNARVDAVLRQALLEGKI
jgi:uncharacterized protein (DUF4415 family)